MYVYVVRAYVRIYVLYCTYVHVVRTYVLNMFELHVMHEYVHSCETCIIYVCMLYVCMNMHSYISTFIKYTHTYIHTYSDRCLHTYVQYVRIYVICSFYTVCTDSSIQ